MHLQALHSLFSLSPDIVIVVAVNNAYITVFMWSVIVIVW